MTASDDTAERTLPPRLERLIEQAKQRTLTAAEFDELQSMIDELFGLRSLMKKWSDGQITDRERAVHDVWMRAFSGRHFEECPVCGGAFALSVFFEEPAFCPCCGTELFRIAIDPVRHSAHEIHGSLPEEPMMGAFTAIVYAKGTHACERCGFVYPQGYSCCPGLLASAIDLTDRRERKRLPNAPEHATAFLEKHRDVLLNALRGAFGRTLHKDRLALLEKIAPKLTCGEELAEILSDLRRRGRW